MKKLSWLLIASMILCIVSVYGADESMNMNTNDAPVVATYTAAFEKEQGKNNWYFCEFGKDKITELSWNKDCWKGAETYPKLRNVDMVPGPASGVGYKFVVPEKGMVRLRGKVVLPYPDSLRGDGVVAGIYKGKKELWASVVKHGSEASYDIITSVREKDELYFRVDRNINNSYDWTQWWPQIEYLGIEYMAESEDYTYFQKKDGEMTQLKFNDELNGYLASDGMAFINSESVMPSKEFSLVRRYVVPENGRYRVYGQLMSDDRRGGGNVVTVYKNGEKVWKQMFPSDEAGTLDVRMMSTKDDIIDVEISINDYMGYNYTAWKCDITKYVGTLFCSASTSAGYSYGVVDEYNLSSIIEAVQKNDNTKFYSIRNDIKYPMSYNTVNKRWESVLNDGGYISSETVYPGSDSDSVMEVVISDSGIIKIIGDLGVNDASDGVLSKIYLNGKILWSSRVGGERPVRWDEPYDVSYFLNSVNATANVVEGDILTISFNQWRKSAGDQVNIKDIKLRYITGNVLSDTTKWKLDNSVVVDTEKKKVYRDGKVDSVDVFAENGTTYIASSDISKLFNADAESVRNGIMINGVQYLALRDVAEDREKTVVWAADRLVLIHSGIPVLFGWPELSEINTALKGGGLFE